MSKFFLRIAVGFIAGVILVIVDNIIFEGEVSPIVIVVILIGITSVFGTAWGWRGLQASSVTWICIPLMHLIKHLSGLPDTLHPNTYTSIAMLAAVTCVIAVMGTLFGVLANRIRKTVIMHESE